VPIPVQLTLVPIVFAMVSIFANPGESRELEWGVYRDEARGCRLHYPKALFSLDTREQGKPHRFSSSDQNIYFRIMGAENTSKWTPQDIREKYLRADMPGDITYERTRGRFLVLSGYRGGNIFYTKVAVSGDQRTACILDITYPKSLKKQFDGIVTRMSRSFYVDR
jgi:hypothetical protein